MELKILVLVMSSSVLKGRVQSVMDSYYNNVKKYSNIDLVFYSDYDDESNDLVVKVEADFEFKYKDNEIKHAAAFKLIRDRFYKKYDWFLFVDDDTYVNVPVLSDNINSFSEDYIHGHYFKIFDYVSGGGGCLISNKLIHNFFDFKTYNSGYADVSLGQNAREKNIEFKHSDFFYASSPWRDNEKDPESSIRDSINNRITYHYVNEPQMQIIYKNYNNGN